MSMQARTLRVLEAANFTQPQAVAIAEAIDSEIHGNELLTVSVLDSRLAAVCRDFGELRVEFSGLKQELKHLISASEIRLTNKMISLGIAATGSIITAVYFLVLHLKG